MDHATKGTGEEKASQEPWHVIVCKSVSHLLILQTQDGKNNQNMIFSES